MQLPASSPFRANLRRAAHRIALLICVFLEGAAFAANPGATGFDIPAGPASETLARFAAQSGLQMAGGGNLLENVQTNPTSGPLSNQQAIDEMLAGTGLAANVDTISGTFTVRQGNTPQPVVKLNPFVVETAKDRGYETEDTLSGTRFDTQDKFVATAVTDVNPAEMQDLALYNTEDLIDFTPNAANYNNGGSLSSDTISNNALFGPYFNIRGTIVSTTSIDFIKDRVEDDAYDIDRVEIDRGPNSVLFGIGDPGGVVNAVSAQAEMKDSYSIMTRTDNWGSSREAVRVNQEIIPGKVAILVAALNEDKRSDIVPSDNVSNRIYEAITIKPFAETEIRGSFENGTIQDVIDRPWPVADGLSTWEAAGSQPIPTASLNGGTYFAQVKAPSASQIAQEPGLVSALAAAGYQVYSSGVPEPTLVANSNAPMPFLDPLGMVITRTVTAGEAKYPNPTLLNSPLPYTANVPGYGEQRGGMFSNYTVTIDQSVGQGLSFEATFNNQNLHSEVDNTANEAANVLYKDENPTLLTMDDQVIANPNYNNYFTIENGMSVGDRYYNDRTFLLQGAYKFDFRDHVNGLLGKILGHINLGALREELITNETIQNSYPTNVTPNGLYGVTPQFPVSATTNIAAGSGGTLQLIHYINPKNPATWAAPNEANLYGGYNNMLFAGAPLPAANPDGITPVWTVGSDTRTLAITNTQSFVAQDFLWDDRIVPLFGIRKDVVDVRDLPSEDATYDGMANWIVDTNKLSMYTGDTGDPLTYYEQVAQTKTTGILVYPLPWFGLFFNQSDSNDPAASTSELNLLGQPLPAAQATGRDWGIKLSLLKDRIVVNLDRYTMLQIDAASQNLRNGFGGTYNLNESILTLTNAMEQLQPNDSTFNGNNYPWIGGDSELNWYNTNNVWSKGYEGSVTANITPNWRLTVNASEQTTAASNYGALETQAYASMLAYVTDKYPQDLNLSIGDGIEGVPETVAQEFQDMKNTLLQAESLSGRIDARQAKYSLNFVTAYDFTTGFLRNFGVGATYRWRSEEAIGYGFLPGSTTLFNANNVYYGEPMDPLGLFVNYKFVIAHRIHGRVQLNADGINMNEKLYPFTATEGTNGQPVIVQYGVGPGTTWAWSTSLDF